MVWGGYFILVCVTEQRSKLQHSSVLFPCSVVLEAQGEMTETLWAHSLCKYRSLPELTSALPEAEPVGLLPTTPQPRAEQTGTM